MEMITIVKKINTLLIISGVAMIMVMSSCTLNEGDPQTTLCQKLTSHLMTENKVNWNQAVKTPSDERLQITVGFNNADGSVTEAVCTYGLNNRDEGEDYELDPDKYVNIPDSMVTNGQDVRTQDLHTAIQKVTGQAITDTFSEENITKKANAASDTVKENTIKIKESAEVAAEQARDAASKAAEELKKGAEQAKELMGDAASKAAEQLKEKTGELRHKAGEALEKAGEKLQE